MAENSKIEWTDATWNPVTGCTPVSAGCTNCYAADLAATRLKHLPAYEGLAQVNSRGQGVFNGTIKLHDSRLLDPLKWRKPRRVFVNSMSDLFHESVPFEFVDKVFAVMALCPQHTFQILTKRPERMAEYFFEFDWDADRILESFGDALDTISDPALFDRGFVLRQTALDDYCSDFKRWPLPNVWLGTSVENQDAADERIPHLLRCPAAVRFLSCEPLLGDVKLGLPHSPNVLRKSGEQGFIRGFAEAVESIRIHWVICGGESGPNARPMHPDWARSLRDQCQAAGVAFFFKQWGEWVPMSELIHHDNVTVRSALATQCSVAHNGDVSKEFVEGCCSMYRIGKARAGRLLDGREWKALAGTAQIVTLKQGDIYNDIHRYRPGEEVIIAGGFYPGEILGRTSDYPEAAQWLREQNRT